MRRILRTTILVMLVSALGASTSERSHRAHNTSQPRASALGTAHSTNTASWCPPQEGRKRPGLVAAVASVLPAQIRHQIVSSPNAVGRRQLLALPAPRRLTPARASSGRTATTTRGTSSPAKVGSSTLPLWLILLLAGLAVVLITTALTRSRTGSHSSSGGDDDAPA